MTGGDFVRNVKQTIDLLRQIADVAPDPATAATARAAADACLPGRDRGVEHRSPRPRPDDPAVRPGEPWERPARRAARRSRSSGDDARPRGGGRQARRARSSASARRDEFRPRAARSGSRRRARADGRRRSSRCDALRLDDGSLACNMVVLGTRPTGSDAVRPDRTAGAGPGRRAGDRSPGSRTTVVVATGQFLRGLDLVPRGHPGDGRAEVQVYTRRRAASARTMRARLADRHAPPASPDPQRRRARRIEIRIRPADPLELDGDRSSAAARRGRSRSCRSAYRAR